MVLSIRRNYGYRRRLPLTSVTKREKTLVGMRVMANSGSNPISLQRSGSAIEDISVGLLVRSNSVYRKGHFSHRSRSDVAANDKLCSNASNIVPIDNFLPYQPSNLGLIN